jgi:hypothetical protein
VSPRAKSSKLLNEKFNPHAAHKSTSKDSRLGELVRATIDALTPNGNETGTSSMNHSAQRQLVDLFVTAQAADMSYKLEVSLLYVLRSIWHFESS